MFTFDASKFVPRFILQDKNGWALTRAIQAGVQMMNDTIQQGAAIINDFDQMPEWRLDELAWESNCLYDYNADVEQKREWIRNALPLYRLFGTPEAVLQYISGYFEAADLEEGWAYGGDAYHFRVTVAGEWTAEKEAFVNKAIATAKNVRSVLDHVRVGTEGKLFLTEATQEYGITFRMAGETELCGTDEM